jgi:hypothetical protein
LLSDKAIVLGDGEEPEEEYNTDQGSDVSISNEDLGCLEHIEDEVNALVAGIFSLLHEHSYDSCKIL